MRSAKTPRPSRPAPLPLRRADPARLARAVGLCFDIDDTLSTEGRLTAPAYAALWAGHQAGLAMVAVTGRPAGWCDHIARMWPVAGVVGENGAFYFAYDPKSRRVRRRWSQSAARRAEGRARLKEVREEVLREVPRARVAADQPYREADLAIDFAEDVGPLRDDEVEAIRRTFVRHRAHAKVSSIHVNGWFGRYDKRGMLLRLAEERLGLDADAAARRLVYVGDSPNDEPLFEAFDLSVGVANVRRFLPAMAHPPRFITSRPAGAGFAELVRALVRAAQAAR